MQPSEFRWLTLCMLASCALSLLVAAGPAATPPDTSTAPLLAQNDGGGSSEPLSSSETLPEALSPTPMPLDPGPAPDWWDEYLGADNLLWSPPYPSLDTWLSARIGGDVWLRDGDACLSGRLEAVDGGYVVVVFGDEFDAPGRRQHVSAIVIGAQARRASDGVRAILGNGRWGLPGFEDVEVIELGLPVSVDDDRIVFGGDPVYVTPFCSATSRHWAPCERGTTTADGEDEQICEWCVGISSVRSFEADIPRTPPPSLLCDLDGEGCSTRATERVDCTQSCEPSELDTYLVAARDVFADHRPVEVRATPSLVLFDSDSCDE